MMSRSYRLAFKKRRLLMIADTFESYHKTLRKGYLVKMLCEKHGMSKRKAAQAVNAVFDLMTRALWRGENVDLPVGSIHAKSPPAGRKTRDQKFRNIQTKEVFSRLVHPPKRMIVFTKDKRLIVRCRGVLLTLEKQRKQEELERLYLQLMGRAITLPDLKLLLNAVIDWNKPDNDPNTAENLDRLLARLRELVKSQRPSIHLPSEVRSLYWIR